MFRRTAFTLTLALLGATPTVYAADLKLFGSISGQVGGIAAHPAYGASKAGVHALTKTYALEGARHGVLCNAVAPGMLAGSMAGEFGEAQLEKLARAAPLRRLGRMEEIARVIRFLCDPTNTFMTGAIVPVNGGALMPG